MGEWLISIQCRWPLARAAARELEDELTADLRKLGGDWLKRLDVIPRSEPVETESDIDKYLERLETGPATTLSIWIDGTEGTPRRAAHDRRSGSGDYQARAHICRGCCGRSRVNPARSYALGRESVFRPASPTALEHRLLDTRASQKSRARRNARSPLATCCPRTRCGLRSWSPPRCSDPGSYRLASPLTASRSWPAWSPS